MDWILPMENEHDALVRQCLEKHFDAVCIMLSKEQVVLNCHLGSVLFRFPFYAMQYYETNPYTVVNTIWEYINTYL